MGWPMATSTQLALFFPLSVMFVHMIRRLIRDRIERKGHPLPPGPPQLPFLGSALFIDYHEPFKTYTQWRATRGDVIYFPLFGTDVIILNSLSAATDLFEKRSQIYSDRPFVATVKPFGFDPVFTFADYGDYWRLCRRIFHQTFRTEAVSNFHPTQLRKARELALHMIDDPNDYMSHFTGFVSAITMCSVYDYDPSPKGDRIVSTINRFIVASFAAIIPESAILLGAFPFLLHLPEWFPVLSYKRIAREAREMSAEAIETPYQYIQRRIESKETLNPSMVSDHLTRMEEIEDHELKSEYEKALKNVSSTAFLAGVDTTNGALKVFTLAMIKNPRTWKRAQAEIDAVMGTDRLPEFSDRPSLPYVDAVLRETLRWQPPTPLGVPHCPRKSDIYNGFYIPKGATVIGNIWAISRDETRYPDPEEFIPERFLDTEGKLTDDFPEFVFGFGRRICPGRFVLESSLWICMATMLATFDFHLAQDTEGRDVEFEPEFVFRATRSPLPFPCRISPRSHIDRAAIEHALAM